MAIRRLFWDFGTDRDIHLLRGTTSRPLTDTGLRVVDENGDQPSAGNYLLTTPQDSIDFRPQFKRTSPLGSDHENADIGIRVDRKTGAVTATPSPSRTKNNFVMEIQGKNHDNSVSNVETIRVHVHDSVTEAWLTPDSLTVRPALLPVTANGESLNFRFGVRARFDTGVVGDLTLNHGVQWASAGPSGPNNNVDVATGRLQLVAGDGPTATPPTVTATLPASLGGATTPAATVRIRQPWESEPDRPQAHIVVGSAWPGTLQPDRVPNVLFVPDGFRKEDEELFKGIVDKVVHHLKTDRLTRPFDLLSTSMNFWRVFWPASTLGISVRSEVFTFPDEGRTWAAAVPIIARPPDTGKWYLAHLIYAVGLPVPADAGRSVTEIKNEWDAVLNVGSWPSNLAGLIGDWKQVANRTFIEELDEFPGMSYGRPPAANSDDNTWLDLHAERASGLRAFCRPLEASNGVTTETGNRLGDVWVTNDFKLYDFDNTDLIVLMSCLNGGRALNSFGYMAMSRGADGYRIAVKRVGNRWHLDLKSPPDEITTDRCRTAAHELGHSFGLGDEYVNFDGQFPDSDKDLEWYGNLQSEASARGANGKISGAEIKWSWHRIRKAAVIAGAIHADPAGAGHFIVPLEAKQALQFKKGDVAKLRVRLEGKPLQKGHKTLEKLLEIADHPVEDAVVVKALSGPPLTEAEVTEYPRRSILYTPTPRFRQEGAVFPFADLLASNVRDEISSRKGPLTAVPCKTDRRDVQKPDLSGITLPGFLCFKHKTRVVGLYAGGKRWACGIFHPAGACIMRNEHDGHTEFCAVCRYVLVDFIDPSRHSEIDRDYAEIYPQE